MCVTNKGFQEINKCFNGYKIIPIYVWYKNVKQQKEMKWNMNETTQILSKPHSFGYEFYIKTDILLGFAKRNICLYLCINMSPNFNTHDTTLNMDSTINLIALANVLSF